MRRGPDATTLVERALLADARACGAAIVVVEAEARRWASATFAGARHRFTIAAAAQDASLRWLSALAEAEFRLRGHLVADIAVTAQTRDAAGWTATIEVLTVEEE